MTNTEHFLLKPTYQVKSTQKGSCRGDLGEVLSAWEVQRKKVCILCISEAGGLQAKGNNQ